MEPDLRRLAELYEREAEATRDDEGYESLAASAAMGQVACALEDAELYERSVRIRSPRPNALQALGIADKYVRFGPVETAIAWLEQAEDDRRDHERLELLVQAHERLGDREALTQARRQLWERSLSAEAFEAHAALLPAKARRAARRKLERPKGSPQPTLVRIRYIMRINIIKTRPKVTMNRIHIGT